MSKLANLFQNKFFIQFIQNILAFTDTKLMTQESRVSNYPICSDKADQVLATALHPRHVFDNLEYLKKMALNTK